MRTINDDLMLFARLDNLTLVKYLVEAGADVKALDDEAMRLAAYHGHLDVVKYLEGKINENT